MDVDGALTLAKIVGKPRDSSITKSIVFSLIADVTLDNNGLTHRRNGQAANRWLGAEAPRASRKHASAPFGGLRAACRSAIYPLGGFRPKEHRSSELSPGVHLDGRHSWRDGGRAGGPANVTYNLSDDLTLD